MTRPAYPGNAPADPTRDLLDAMGRARVEPLEPIAGALASGRLVRFRAEGDKRGRRNGWAVLRPNGWAFGHWRTGVRASGRAGDGEPVTSAERARWRRELTAAQALRMRERAAAHEKGRTAALALWRGARAADGAHPYLCTKQMTAEGLRQHGRDLLIPMRDLATGELWNVQRIALDGRKLFQPGARVAGLAWGRGAPGDALALCEGVATAAAVHAATGLCGIAAMTKANLADVAGAIRWRWPRARVIVGADHDADGGGELAAHDAARLVDGLVALPPRPSGWSGPAWDYADLWSSPGDAALIRASFRMGEGA